MGGSYAVGAANSARHATTGRRSRSPRRPLGRRTDRVDERARPALQRYRPDLHDDRLRLTYQRRGASRLAQPDAGPRPVQQGLRLQMAVTEIADDPKRPVVAAPRDLSVAEPGPDAAERVQRRDQYFAGTAA
ncbi:MAG TPA: hypothetical protein VF054_20060 [Micromonosporaceae bacterium]